MTYKDFHKEIPEEVSWQVDDKITEPWNNFKRGLRNWWSWKKVIWEDRWYSNEYIDSILLHKLKTMDEKWSGAHYVGSEVDHKEIRKLIRLLEEIKKREDDFSLNNDKEIQELYSEFGRRLYSVRKIPTEFNKTAKTNFIQRLWD